MIRLGEVSKVIAGQAAPKEFSNVGLPFIRAGHLKDLLEGTKLNELPKVSNEVADKKRLKTIPSGTIIFAKSGMSATKNRIYITESEAYIVSHLAGILPNKKISEGYLSRYLSYYNPSNLILDEAYPSIRLEDINNLKIPIPQLDQQKKIAAILDAADAYRQKTKALIEKYDELTQSLFLDMFGDPVTNPRGYEKINLGDISHMKAGKFVKAVDIKSEENPNLHSCYGGNGLRGYVESFTHEGEFLLIGRQGALCGNVKIVNGKFHATEHAVVCSPIMKYESLWLYHMLVMINLNKYATGAAQPGLNVGTLVELEVVFPPNNLQCQFAERVQAIEAQKAQAEESLAQAEGLFNSLLQRAFKGELTN